ncbi:DUF2339 domain-containing protein [Aureivirga sp. CE67]|uniref:DUF2339 domain-containing protein n=1 Tax=Aureivirga sp. CE67 TaxID=1788983 RepID=UPI0018C95EBC|nr:DUF2339 domain-containing protein [Aureivirga sp. CE67]
MKCKNCSYANYHEGLLCLNCNKLLYSHEITLSKLELKQFQLEKRHQNEMKFLREEISSIKSLLITEKQEEKKVVKPIESIIQKEIIQKPVVEEKKEIVREKITPTQKIESKTETPTNKEVLEAHREFVPKPKRKEFKTPAFLLELTGIFAPFLSGFDLFKKLYLKFKTEGKLPIFFMTIAGIVAILFGLGYFLQSDLLGVYSELLRNILGFGVAALVGFFGVRLQKKEKLYQEFGSALISLSILLGYLVTYYTTQMTNFPVFSSAKIGFLLIVANTGIAIFFAFRFETKIIALLSLVGGALTPFFLGNEGNSDLYFAYLWILIFAANFIANKIKWKELNYVSFLLFVAIMETSLFFSPSASIFFIAIIHAFTYLFFYIILFEKKKLKKSLSKDMIVILAGNISLLLYHLYASIDNPTYLGFTYIGNALIFIGILAVYWRNISKKVKVGLFITIGAFLGFAIPCLFSKDLIGLFWAIEAFLLIILGFHFSFPNVRKEGYLVLLISLTNLVLDIINLGMSWRNHDFENGFIGWVILGIVLLTLIVLGKKYEKETSQSEKYVIGFTRGFFPLWCSATLFLVSHELIGNYAFNLFIIPMFGLIYWGKVWKSKFIEAFGILHFIALLVAFTISSLEVNSLRISEQTPYGIIGIISFILSMFLLKSFYQLIKYTQSENYQFISYLRELFFTLIPYIFARQIFKYFGTNILVPFIWVSTLMTYGLYKWRKNSTLLVSSFILFVSAFAINVMEFSLIGGILGIISIVAIVLIEKGLDNELLEKSKYSVLIILSPYLVSIYILRILFDIKLIPADSGITILGVIISAMFLFHQKYKLLDNTKVFAIYISIFISLLGGVMSLFVNQAVFSFGFLLLLIFIQFLYNSRNEKYGVFYKKQGAWNLHFLFIQFLIIESYVLLIPILGMDINGPATTIFLAIHAIVLVFVALKKQLKFLNRFSIFLFVIGILKLSLHDIKDFSTNSKVLVFVLLGVLLLVASFAYVKLKPKFEKIENEELEGLE